jgi:hypothetical protein
MRFATDTGGNFADLIIEDDDGRIPARHLNIAKPRMNFTKKKTRPPVASQSAGGEYEYAF